MFLLIFIFCCFALVLLLLFHYKKSLNLPPGPARLPIIGSIPFLPGTFRIKGRGLHTPKLFYYLAQKYGAVCHVWLGPVPTIVISDAKILKKAFKNANMSSRPIMKPFHQFRYGTNVSMSKLWCVTLFINRKLSEYFFCQKIDQSWNVMTLTVNLFKKKLSDLKWKGIKSIAFLKDHTFIWQIFCIKFLFSAKISHLFTILDYPSLIWQKF